jgi:hypothetical protein
MATLERLVSEVGRAFGPKRIWLTEYAYQTGSYGVTQQRQAEMIGQAALRVHKAPAGGHADPLPRQGRAGVGALPERLYAVPARRSSRRSRSRCRSRRRGAAAAGSSSGARCGRVPACRPTACRCARRRLELRGRHAQDGSRVASSASPWPRRRGASLRIYSPQDGAYSAAIRAG